MRLRSRSVIISIGLVCSLALILFLYSHLILMQGYIDLEEQYAKKNVYQVIKAVQSEAVTLDMITDDSAANNDAYLFMITERQKYIQDNLLNDTLYDLGINFALLYSLDGELVFARAVDPWRRIPACLPGRLIEYIQTDSTLIKHLNVTSLKNGVFLHEKYPVILSSRPIITSLKEGPLLGTLIMGKYLDDSEFAHLSDKLQLQTSFHSIIDNNELPGLDQASSPEVVYINIIRPSIERIEGYGFIKDLTGTRSLGIKVELPREIFKQGKSTITTFNRVYFGTALFYIAVIMAVFQKTVLSRIISLSSSVKSIRDSDDLTKKVDMKGNDEISELGDEFNRLLKGLDYSLKELKTYSESLEELVDEKTKELLESERLAAIGKTVSMVGHDVRNPLMAITNAAYLLKKGSDQETTHSMINIINRSAKYINQIFEDLTGHLQVNPLNRNYQRIDTLIENILSMTFIPDSIDVKLSLDPVEGYIDDVKFRRVMSNLIRNSIEAIPEKGTLDISCTSEAQTIYIKIVDNGKGIHSDIIDKVYTPFFTTKQNGLGLGLSYVKQVVEEHGGSINIISKVDIGTDITIKLPLEQDLSGSFQEPVTENISMNDKQTTL